MDGAKRYFLYSDEGLVGEYGEKGEETRTYGYVPDSIWTTNPLFLKLGENVYWYNNDYLGTPHILASIDSRAVWKVEYMSFGGIAIRTETKIINNIRHPGQYYDSEIKLNYNKYRYYNPILGRYSRSDPVNKINEMDKYTYAINNPVNIVDPDGLIGIGGGAYYLFGAEISLCYTECCENNILYEFKLLTVCGGVGVGISGTLPIGASVAGVASVSECPRTRYYFKHENELLYHSVNIQGDSQGPSAGMELGVYGISTKWVFCSDTIISKKRSGCCR